MSKFSASKCSKPKSNKNFQFSHFLSGRLVNITSKTNKQKTLKLSESSIEDIQRSFVWNYISLREFAPQKKVVNSKCGPCSQKSLCNFIVFLFWHLFISFNRFLAIKIIFGNHISGFRTKNTHRTTSSNELSSFVQFSWHAEHSTAVYFNIFKSFFSIKPRETHLCILLQRNYF